MATVLPVRTGTSPGPLPPPRSFMADLMLGSTRKQPLMMSFSSPRRANGRDAASGSRRSPSGSPSRGMIGSSPRQRSKRGRSVSRMLAAPYSVSALLREDGAQGDWAAANLLANRNGSAYRFKQLLTVYFFYVVTVATLAVAVSALVSIVYLQASVAALPFMLFAVATLHSIITHQACAALLSSWNGHEQVDLRRFIGAVATFSTPSSLPLQRPSRLDNLWDSVLGVIISLCEITPMVCTAMGGVHTRSLSGAILWLFSTGVACATVVVCLRIVTIGAFLLVYPVVDSIPAFTLCGRVLHARSGAAAALQCMTAPLERGAEALALALRWRSIAMIEYTQAVVPTEPPTLAERVATTLPATGTPSMFDASPASRNFHRSSYIARRSTMDVLAAAQDSDTVPAQRRPTSGSTDTDWQANLLARPSMGSGPPILFRPASAASLPAAAYARSPGQQRSPAASGSTPGTHRGDSTSPRSTTRPPPHRPQLYATPYASEQGKAAPRMSDVQHTLAALTVPGVEGPTEEDIAPLPAATEGSGMLSSDRSESAAVSVLTLARASAQEVTVRDDASHESPASTSRSASTLAPSSRSAPATIMRTARAYDWSSRRGVGPDGVVASAAVTEAIATIPESSYESERAVVQAHPTIEAGSSASRVVEEENETQTGSGSAGSADMKHVAAVHDVTVASPAAPLASAAGGGDSDDESTKVTKVSPPVIIRSLPMAAIAAPAGVRTGPVRGLSRGNASAAARSLAELLRAGNGALTSRSVTARRAGGAAGLMSQGDAEEHPLSPRIELESITSPRPDADQLHSAPTVDVGQVTAPAYVSVAAPDGVSEEVWAASRGVVHAPGSELPWTNVSTYSAAGTRSVTRSRSGVDDGPSNAPLRSATEANRTRTVSHVSDGVDAAARSPPTHKGPAMLSTADSSSSPTRGSPRAMAASKSPTLEDSGQPRRRVMGISERAITLYYSADVAAFTLTGGVVHEDQVLLADDCIPCACSSDMLRSVVKQTVEACVGTRERGAWAMSSSAEGVDAEHGYADVIDEHVVEEDDDGDAAGGLPARACACAYAGMAQACSCVCNAAVGSCCRRAGIPQLLTSPLLLLLHALSKHEYTCGWRCQWGIAPWTIFHACGACGCGFTLTSIFSLVLTIIVGLAYPRPVTAGVMSMGMILLFFCTLCTCRRRRRGGPAAVAATIMKLPTADTAAAAAGTGPSNAPPATTTPSATWSSWMTGLRAHGVRNRIVAGLLLWFIAAVGDAILRRGTPALTPADILLQANKSNPYLVLLSLAAAVCFSSALSTAVNDVFSSSVVGHVHAPRPRFFTGLVSLYTYTGVAIVLLGSTLFPPQALEGDGRPMASNTTTTPAAALLGVCAQRWGGLHIDDAAYFAALAYDDMSIAQADLDAWFNTPSAAAASGGAPDWSIIAYEDHPVQWYHVYSPSRNASVVTVRGTAQLSDELTNFAFFGDSMLVQAFSALAPFAALLSDSAVATLVESFGRVNFVRAAVGVGPRMYVDPLLQYVRAAQADGFTLPGHTQRLKSDSWLFIGHSMGGSVAALAGAATGWPVISISGPGVYYSRNVFGVTKASLLQHLTNVLPEMDVLSQVDRVAGQTQLIPCALADYAPCHRMHSTIQTLQQLCGNPTGRDYRDLFAATG